MTRALREICNTTEVSNMISHKPCKHFVVLPIELCYAIKWNKNNMFFEEQYLDDAMNLLNNSIIAHIWNRLTAGKKLYKTTNAAYNQLAKKYCPKVYKLSTFF